MHYIDTSGEPPLDPSKAEASVIIRSVEDEWPINQEQRLNTVRCLNEIQSNKRYSARDRIRAARALASLNRMNLEARGLLSQPTITSNVNLGPTLVQANPDQAKQLKAFIDAAGIDEG